jgi:hypothetical protein
MDFFNAASLMALLLTLALPFVLAFAVLPF